jgi:peroxiredoxin-like protein
MDPFPHHYRVALEGAPRGEASVTAEGIAPLRVALPVQFGGPGDAWSPEHLLLVAVEACFLFTLRAVAKASGVELVDVRAEADGVLDRREGVTRFTEIVLRPTVTVRAGVDRERVRRAIEKAERNCLISASLSTPVHLESIVSEAHEPSTPQTEAA